MGIITSINFSECYTPICNDCGIQLCYDISQTDYEKSPDFWDNWRCEECNPYAKGSFLKYRVEKRNEQSN